MGTTEANAGASEIVRVDMDVVIDAAVDHVFKTITTRFNDWMRGEHDEAMKLTLEPVVGGRLYRDLGDDAGHLWGHVQVIKPPKLLEIIGPLFVSGPSVSHLTFRLEEEGAGTRLKFRHHAMGVFPKEMGEGVNEGWRMVLDNHLKPLCEGAAK